MLASHHKLRIIVILILLSLAAAIYIFSQTSYTRQSIPQPNLQGNARMYPNKQLTPGAVFQNVSIQTICQSGYTKRVRDVTVSLKEMVYQEYGMSYPQPSGSYEVDHFIPLALGGSNEITNLWPEPAYPKPGYHEKDEVELYLHNQVCNGNLSLQQAQMEIQTDWYKVYLSLPQHGQASDTIF